MSEIEVLEWLLKSKKAGYNYFVVDFMGKPASIYKINLLDKSAFVIDGATPELTLYFEHMNNPRLPQKEYGYMDAMDLAHKTHVKSLESGRIWTYSHIFGCCAVLCEGRLMSDKLLLEKERLGKWVVAS